MLLEYGKIVAVMNKRATLLSRPRRFRPHRPWTAEREFRQLLHWAQNATKNQLREFCLDTVQQDAPPQVLFLRINSL